MSNKWSRLLCLELILLGAGIFTVILFAPALGIDAMINRGPIKALILGLGVSTSLLGIILSLPRIRTRVGFQRMEVVAHYIQHAALWCLLPLIFFELFLRVYLYTPVLRVVETNWFGDLPARGAFVLLGNEGFAITRYKDLGEIWTPYDSGENIIFVGDSRTEAKQVADNEKFASVAESLLWERQHQVNVRNLGEGGRAIADYVTYIPYFKTMYNPKVIVIQVSENDFSESFSPSKTNYFRMGADGKIDVIRENEVSAALQVSSTSKINIYPMIARQAVRQFELMSPDAAQENDAPDMDLESVENAKETRIRLQLNLILDAADGTPVIFVLAPNKPVILQDSIVLDDAAYEKFKALLIETTGSVVVDPLPRFQQLVKDGHFPVGFYNSADPDRGHLNQYGNRVVGELLADAIIEVLK